MEEDLVGLMCMATVAMVCLLSDVSLIVQVTVTDPLALKTVTKINSSCSAERHEYSRDTNCSFTGSSAEAVKLS